MPSTRILRAVIAAIRPRGHGFDQAIDDDVLADIGRFFPYLPWPLRIGLPLGLYLVEFGPPIFLRRFCRFSSLPLPDAQEYLRRLHHTGGVFEALMMGLRTLVFLAFYQHPRVLAVLDIDWASRAEALTKRRAELLHEHAS